ncbi:hypothetical protein ACQ4PT_044503 [Festuca glaucescens]
MPGRASLSSSWLDDKKMGLAGTSTWGVERASRPTWRDSCGSGGKRPASRAPSADHSEKKHKPPILIEAEAVAASRIAMEIETEAAPATTVVVKTEAAPGSKIVKTETAATPLISIEMETAPAPEVVVKKEAAPAPEILVEKEAAPEPEIHFAGPSFSLSPDPSELPLPSLFIRSRLARLMAGYVLAELGLVRLQGIESQHGYDPERDLVDPDLSPNPA